MLLARGTVHSSDRWTLTRPGLHEAVCFEDSGLNGQNDRSASICKPNQLHFREAGVDRRKSPVVLCPQSEMLPKSQRKYFRDDLRRARYAALADAEAYASILTSIERLARFMNRNVRSLAQAKPMLSNLASRSVLATTLPSIWPHYHRTFDVLFESVRIARNDVMHTGAKARHLTNHAVETCLILEDALQDDMSIVSDFMVIAPITIERWQPISLLRHRMLEYSFTFMPIEPDEQDGSWRFVSDSQLMTFIQRGAVREERLSMSVTEAFQNGLESFPAGLINAEEPTTVASKRIKEQPLLVEFHGRVVGIVTAFDLL